MRKKKVNYLQTRKSKHVNSKEKSKIFIKVIYVRNGNPLMVFIIIVVHS
jgi:hypothetical protein